MSSALQKNILVFDTAYQWVVAALQSGVESSYLEKQDREKNSQTILPCLSQLMQKHALSFSQLHAIGVGVGPGRFTGIRVGICVAQGLAFANHIPIIPLSSLQILARSARFSASRWIWVVMHAKLNYVYYGIFSASSLLLQTPEKMIPVFSLDQAFSQFDAQCDVLLCDDSRLLQAHLNLPWKETCIIEKSIPHAKDMLSLALHEAERGILIKAHELKPSYGGDWEA